MVKFMMLLECLDELLAGYRIRKLMQIFTYGGLFKFVFLHGVLVIVRDR